MAPNFSLDAKTFLKHTTRSAAPVQVPATPRKKSRQRKTTERKEEKGREETEPVTLE
jgi:hypothetical protein